MSSEFSIRVAGLSKCFNIYERPHHRLMQTLLRGHKRFYREFWALRDVSFDVKKGEAVGIVGRNGSGKSTLLQLICGTLGSSSGAVITHGRVAALLELGSGFNPEFTGRENAYVNGQLLGLSRESMNDLMPEIIAFSGIGSFIDQPVKHYSSGMVVRLAFSVYVNVMPDILIVDEALSVGDAVFQHKCARKIHELRARGTTLLFVSHDPSAVATFCDRAILLHQGGLVAMGAAKEIVELYLARNKNELYVSDGAVINNTIEASSFIDFVPALLGEGESFSDFGAIKARIGTGAARVVSLRIVAEDGRRSAEHIVAGEAFRLRVVLEAINEVVAPVLCYRVDTLRGIPVTGSVSSHDGVVLPSLAPGERLEVDILTTLPLKADTYSLGLYLNSMPSGLPPVVVDGLETAVHLKLMQAGQSFPIYMVDTPRLWQVVSSPVDPAGRRVTQGGGLGSERWSLSVRGVEFSAPDHWFWPQYVDDWETDTFLIFQRFLSPGSKFVDVGAWIGPTIMFASALGVDCIHAVEANPATVGVLNNLIEHSPSLQGNVVVHNLCIGAGEGEVEFGNKDGSQVTSSASSIRGTGFRVRSIGLRSFMEANKLLDADLMKIDIEGAEELIVDDLAGLAADFGGAIWLSLHPPFWRSPEGGGNLLAAIGLFKVFDGAGNSLAISDLERRFLDKSDKPEWGTEFGNFFEILLLPAV